MISIAVACGAAAEASDLAWAASMGRGAERVAWTVNATPVPSRVAAEMERIIVRIAASATLLPPAKGRPNKRRNPDEIRRDSDGARAAQGFACSRHSHPYYNPWVLDCSRVHLCRSASFRMKVRGHAAT